MRTTKLALAAVLAATALAANAGPRMESGASPFTYEAVGATPVVTFGRSVATPKSVETPKPAAAVKAPSPATGAAGNASAALTYDAIGATPHIELRKQPSRNEVTAPAAAR